METNFTDQKNEILALLGEINDPEVPALSITDLGIVRGVVQSGRGITVQITPTYSGCPALDAITGEIETKLHGAGHEEVRVEIVLTPAWTTDWISEAGRKKLEDYGIAPPQGMASETVQINPRIPCPFCKQNNTERKSEFGSTACKALYYCRACNQPFEYFKTF